MNRQRKLDRIHDVNAGPSISAVPLWGSSGGMAAPLLDQRERSQLAAIASVVQYKKGDRIIREGTSADAVLNIHEGVVKTCKFLATGAEHVVAFLFPGDLIGLAQEGRYENTAVAVTPVTAFKFSVASLKALLQKDAEIEFQVITKLSHELRASQRHAFYLSHRSVQNKLALFLQLIEEYQRQRGARARPLFLPMARIDIASYLGVSPETLSRAFDTLERAGAISLPDRRHVVIADRAKFEASLGRVLT